MLQTAKKVIEVTALNLGMYGKANSGPIPKECERRLVYTHPPLSQFPFLQPTKHDD